MPRYQGGCHCGAIRFEFEGRVEAAEVCNCSICVKTAYLHWYADPSNFQLLRGEAEIADYRFGTRRACNLFCRTCGISPFRRARSDPDKIDINLRCVEGIDLDTLALRDFDGLHWEEAMRRR